MRLQGEALQSELFPIFHARGGRIDLWLLISSSACVASKLLFFGGFFLTAIKSSFDEIWFEVAGDILHIKRQRPPNCFALRLSYCIFSICVEHNLSKCNAFSSNCRSFILKDSVCLTTCKCWQKLDTCFFLFFKCAFLILCSHADIYTSAYEWSGQNVMAWHHTLGQRGGRALGWAEVVSSVRPWCWI